MAMGAKAETGTGYKLRSKAALRVDRLFHSMGEEGQMEDDPRYRENMLGSKYRYPMTAVAETPMRKINNALELSSKVKGENLRRAKKKGS